MLRRFFVFRCVLMLAAAPVLAQDRADAILVLADDGGLEGPAVRAIRNIAAAELRKRGVALSEDRRTEGIHPTDYSLTDLADSLGARRIYLLRIGGRLGQKIPLSLEELTPALVPVQAASLTALGLEECDVVTARLVQAVVDRRSVESTAEMRTVTSSESKAFAKKPGERFWFIGLPVALYNAGQTGQGPPFGFSLGYGYEGENFRISATGGGYSRGEGVGYLALDAAWIPLAGEISPYIGGGLGYMGAGGRGGMGAIAEAGVEAFRLHGVRALAGVQVALPFFDTGSTPSSTQSRSVYPAGFIRLAF